MPAILACRGKGRIWEMFDRYFSSADLSKRLRHKLDVLQSLHSTPHFMDFERGPGTGFGAADIAALRQHISRDWFGLSEDGTPSAGEGESTGRWQGWRGDAEGIARETVIRAIEVSLGLEHLPWTGSRKDPIGDYRIGRYGTARNWPMEFWCAGPFPSLQASLSWQSYGMELGRVEVTWLLPAVAGHSFAAGLADGTGFELGPPNPVGDLRRTGSWIVGQERAKQDGDVHVSSGDVVVAEPTLAAGGVGRDSDQSS